MNVRKVSDATFAPFDLVIRIESEYDRDTLAHMMKPDYWLTADYVSVARLIRSALRD